MEKFDRFYKELENHLEELEKQFLSDIDYTIIPPKPEDIWNIKAYVAFAHASFENLFEKVAINILKESIKLAKKDFKKTNDTIIALVEEIQSPKIREAFANLLKFKIQGKKTKKGDFKKSYEELLNELERKLEKIIEDNHGITIKFLDKMYKPLGISFDNNAYIDSLEKIGNMRGEFAHKPSIDDNTIKKDLYTNSKNVNNWGEDLKT